MMTVPGHHYWLSPGPRQGYRATLCRSGAFIHCLHCAAVTALHPPYHQYCTIIMTVGLKHRIKYCRQHLPFLCLLFLTLSFYIFSGLATLPSVYGYPIFDISKSSGDKIPNLLDTGRTSSRWLLIKCNISVTRHIIFIFLEYIWLWIFFIWLVLKWLRFVYKKSKVAGGVSSYNLHLL